ncbi:MAG: IS21 family transposase [Acidimicrobiia bacterium]
MLSQEEFMDVKALRRQGLTLDEIAAETGYHPATIRKWLAVGGPPARRRAQAPPVIDERWAARVAELLAPAPRLLATSVFEILRAEGFCGSYASVARHLNTVRGPRFRAAATVSVPIETAPGEEGQFDFSDVDAWTDRWGLGPVVLFGAVLSWSRYRWWWFTSSEDREHTFEGLVRFFEAVGGVPRVARTDRMGALGTSQGRRFRLHPPTLAFAQWHGCEIRGCQPRDAKRKGKVERPFRDAKEAFLTELDALGPPATIGELNERATAWLDERVHARPHRTTGVPPVERLETERRMLLALPRRRFDTARVESRRVHVAVPMIEWAGVRYSVPPGCLGQRVEVRHEVDSDRIEVRWGAQTVASHRLARPGVEVVWDAAHHAAAQAAALAPHRRHLHVVPDADVAVDGPVVGRLELDGDYDVEPLDLARYDLDRDELR